jgi:alpha-1,6-mannosyltransferase
MKPQLRWFAQTLSLYTDHPRPQPRHSTAVLSLAGLAGLSALVYLFFFTWPYNLFDYYHRPRLTLAPFLKDDPLAPYRLMVFFLGQGALYWLAWRAALRTQSRAAWAIVFSGTLVFSLILLFLYPIDAADIFDNIMHGRILGVYGANPFREVAKQFAADPFLPYVAWKESPSAYGPLWEMLAGGLARLAGNGIIANVLVFKLVGVLFLFAAMGLVAVILRRQAPQRVLAGVVLLAWNPLVLYETAGNGHNDIVMAVWLLAAVWAVLKGRYTLAILALLVGALIKYMPLLLLPVVAVMAWRSLAEARARLHFMVMTTLASLSLMVLAYAPFWYGPEMLTITRRANLYTASLPAVAYSYLQQLLGQAEAGQVVSLTALALTLAFVAWQTRQAWRDTSWLSFPRAAFNILMFYLLLTCLWFQQWYVIWPLTLAALLPPGYAPGLAVLFSFTAITKHLVFGPLLFWANPRPPRQWLELRFGPLIMIIIWLYALAAMSWGRWRQLNAIPKK